MRASSAPLRQAPIAPKRPKDAPCFKGILLLACEQIAEAPPLLTTRVHQSQTPVSKGASQAGCGIRDGAICRAAAVGKARRRARFLNPRPRPLARAYTHLLTYRERAFAAVPVPPLPLPAPSSPPQLAHAVSPAGTPWGRAQAPGFSLFLFLCFLTQACPPSTPSNPALKAPPPQACAGMPSQHPFKACPPSLISKPAPQACPPSLPLQASPQSAP